MKGLSSISPVGLTLLAVIIAFLSIASLDNDELNVIGNWLIGIGGLMVIAATQGAYITGLETEKSRETMLKKQLELLHEEIKSYSGRQRTSL